MILYDGDCAFCNRAIRVILSHDRKKEFLFGSLQGVTAKEMLKDSPLLHPPFETMVLIEKAGTPHQKIFTYAQGSLRIAWHLGGKFAPLGLLSFLPGFLFKAFYRMIARRRHKLFSDTVMIDKSEYAGRFLP